MCNVKGLKWPYNFVAEINQRGEMLEPTPVDYEISAQHAVDIIDAIRTLRPPTTDKIISHYRDGMTYTAIAKRYEVTPSAIKSAIQTGTRKLRHSSYREVILYGREAAEARRQERSTETPLNELNFSTHTYNHLQRSNVGTLSDLIGLVKSGKLNHTNGIGTVSCRAILSKIRELTGEDYYYLYPSIKALS